MSQLTKLGIQNFRVFGSETMTEFDFAPITLLTGANNSGKSSVLKALSLLKNSFDKNGNIEKLNFEGLDLGTYEMNVNDDDEEKGMIFNLSFELDFKKDLTISYLFAIDDENEENKLSQIIILEGKEQVLRIRGKNISINLLKFKEWIDATPEHLISYGRTERKYVIMRKDLYKCENYNHNLPITENFDQTDTNNYDNDFLENVSSTNNDLSKEILAFCLFDGKHFQENPIREFDYYNKFWLNFANYITLIQVFNIGRSYSVSEPDIEWLNDTDEDGVPIYNNRGDITTFFDNRIYKATENCIAFFNVIILGLKKGLKKHIQTLNIEYLSTYRTNQQVVHTDYSAKTDFGKLLDKVNLQNKQAKKQGKESNLDSLVKKINKWAGIEKIIIEDVVTKSYNFNAKIVWVKQDGQKILLSNMGTGIAQIVALLMQIAVSEEGQTIIVEEPETNLHPKLQTELAGLLIFARTQTKGLRIIVETHSEYLIRGFQIRVADEKHIAHIANEDIVIYYLNNPKNLKESENQATKIEFKKNGSIDFEQFGKGFFDKDYNTQYGLLNIQREVVFKKIEELRKKYTKKKGKLSEDEFIAAFEKEINFFIDGQTIEKYEKEISLILGIPNDDKTISKKTFGYLASAKYLMANMGDSKDYLPVVFQYGLAVENEIKLYFPDNLKGKFNNFNKFDIAILATPFDFLQDEKNGFKQKPFTFFQMQYCLAICKDGRANSKIFFKDLKRSLDNDFNLNILWQIEFLQHQLVDKIRKFRNYAAHASQDFDETEAKEMQKWVIEFFKQWISAKN
jgi:predicted ATPase